LAAIVPSEGKMVLTNSLWARAAALLGLGLAGYAQWAAPVISPQRLVRGEC